MRFLDIEAEALKRLLILSREREIYDEEIDQCWQEVVALTARIRARTSDGCETELRALGRRLMEGPWRLACVRTGPPGPDTILALVPVGREIGGRDMSDGALTKRYEFWCKAERLPFELAANDRGFLVDQGTGTVRVLGRRADPPLVVGEKPLRVLVVAASPRDHEGRGAARAVAAVDDAIRAAGSELPIEVVTVEGPGTWAQLQALARERADWDIVHLVAHGQRTPGSTTGGGSILVETDTGHASAEPFPEFANGLKKILRSVRLFTLAVCDSSPLALELAYLFPSASSVGLLCETTQAVADRCFGQLYGQLLDTRQKGQSHLSLNVRDAVSRLRDAREPEWFLVVTYVPAETSALFDWEKFAAHRERRRQSRERREEIERLARSGRLDEALDRTKAAMSSPDPDLAAWAKSMALELRALLDCEKHLTNVEEQVARECSSANPDWAGLHARLEQVQLEAAPTAGGVAARDHVPLPDVVHVLREVKAHFESNFRRAVAGVLDLSESERGKLRRLADGCAKLVGFLRARRDQNPAVHGPLAQEVLHDVMRRGIGVRLAQIETALAGMGAIDAGSLAHLLAVTETLADMDLVMVRGAEELGGSFEKERQHWARVFDRLRAVVGPLLQATRPPIDLLVPGRRVELIQWTKSTGGATTAAHEPVPSTIAAVRDRLLAWTEVSGVGAPVDLRRLPAPLWTALANLTPPLRPVACAEEALHPMLVLAEFGVGADAKMDQWQEVTTRVTGNPDRGRRELLLPAADRLTRETSRLALDLTTLPCATPELVLRGLRAAAEHILAGRQPSQDEIGTEGEALDRLCLLLVAGRMQEAARLAVEIATEQAVRRPPQRFERLRGAYLVLAHVAHVTALDPGSTKKEYVARVREAIAVLGMLVANPECLATWVRTRLGYYGLVCPQDVEPLVEQMLRELQRPVEQAVLARVAAAPEVTRSLQADLDGELNGARLSLRMGLSRSEGAPFVGGYLAAQMCKFTHEIGQHIGFIYRQLSIMSLADRMNLPAGGTVTVDTFHDLVFAFSGLRLADLATLRELLWTDTLAAGELIDTDELLARADDFPMHAALPRAEADRVLSAHVAIRLGRVCLQQLRTELGQAKWERPPVKGLVDILSLIDGYVERLGYRLDGEVPRCGHEVARTTSDWLGSLSARMRDEKGRGAEKEDLRRQGVQACTFLDLLQPEHRIFQTVDMARARAWFYFAYSTFVANEFEEWRIAWRRMRLALDAEPDNPAFIKNYLAAVSHEAQRLAYEDRQPGQARALVKQAVDHAELRLQAVDENDRREIEHFIETLRDLKLAEAQGPGPRLAIPVNKGGT